MPADLLEFPTVEARDEAWISAAVEIVTCVRLGGKLWRTSWLPKQISQAAQEARECEAALKATGHSKEVMIYAVTAQGRSALIPRERWVNLPSPAETR